MYAIISIITDKCHVQILLPMVINFSIKNKQGPGPGGGGGVGGGRTPPRIRDLLVKILKIRKIIFFISIGPPLGKNRSLAPDYDIYL